MRSTGAEGSPESSWRACLLAVRLSRIHLRFASASTTRAELLAAAPDVYYVTDHYVGYSAVLVGCYVMHFQHVFDSRACFQRPSC